MARDSTTRDMLIDATSRIMVDEGYAAATSRRVAAEFPDDELNRLATSVNTLVTTVDRGITETGAVLAALAQADLTQRVEGDYHGAFLGLKQDANAVAEKLNEIVAQLRQTSRALKMATGEILSGANDLSTQTTRQAATIANAAMAGISANRNASLSVRAPRLLSFANLPPAQ